MREFFPYSKKKKKKREKRWGREFSLIDPRASLALPKDRCVSETWKPSRRFWNEETCSNWEEEEGTLAKGRAKFHLSWTSTFEIHVGPSETGTRCIHATTASNVEAKGKRALLAVVFNANRFQQRSRSQWNISRDVRLIEKTDLWSRPLLYY